VVVKKAGCLRFGVGELFGKGIYGHERKWCGDEPCRFLHGMNEHVYDQRMKCQDGSLVISGRIIQVYGTVCGF
jgi:hypothetical protein